MDNSNSSWINSNTTSLIYIIIPIWNSDSVSDNYNNLYNYIVIVLMVFSIIIKTHLNVNVQRIVYNL